MIRVHYRQILATAAALLFGLSITAHAQDTDVPPNSLVVDDNGNIGAGIENPQRQLHLSGDNAVFRMDRPTDTAAFLMTRTTFGGIPLKTFVVGTNASGSNNGEFIINDLGTATSGAGIRRMTIDNNGDVFFTGSVFQNSSSRFKQDIETLGDASESVEQLRGVRFVRKDTGLASLGLIAEEVVQVYPELVEVKDGAAVAVNYSALTAVLVEALKEQRARIDAQEQELADYRAEAAAQQARVDHLEERLSEFEMLKVRLDQIENLMIRRDPRTVALP